jgi:hypothetical protein
MPVIAAAAPGTLDKGFLHARHRIDEDSQAPGVFGASPTTDGTEPRVGARLDAAAPDARGDITEEEKDEDVEVEGDIVDGAERLGVAAATWAPSAEAADSPKCTPLMDRAPEAAVAGIGVAWIEALAGVTMLPVKTGALAGGELSVETTDWATDSPVSGGNTTGGTEASAARDGDSGTGASTVPDSASSFDAGFGLCWACDAPSALPRKLANEASVPRKLRSRFAAGAGPADAGGGGV